MHQRCIYTKFLSLTKFFLVYALIGCTNSPMHAAQPKANQQIILYDQIRNALTKAYDQDKNQVLLRHKKLANIIYRAIPEYMRLVNDVTIETCELVCKVLLHNQPTDSFNVFWNNVLRNIDTMLAKYPPLVPHNENTTHTNTNSIVIGMESDDEENKGPGFLAGDAWARQLETDFFAAKQRFRNRVIIISR